MDGQYSRTEMLFGKEAMEKLRRSRVAVFGVGGVGGYVAEALARSGVGALDLIDNDVVAPSDLNRQIIALRSTIGQNKVDVMAQRIADIDPDIRVTRHKVFYLPERGTYKYDRQGMAYTDRRDRRRSRRRSAAFGAVHPT